MTARRELRATIRVWIIALDDARIGPSILRLLAPEERARAATFKTRELTRRFVAGRAALRVLLGAELDVHPACVPIGIGRHGKPQLRAEAQVEFNLSHSGGVGAVAISTGAPVGVDLEPTATSRDALAIANRFFDDYEANVLASLPRDLLAAGFIRCWTGKEAVLKALGVGLTQPLRDVVIEPDPRRAPEILRLPGSLGASAWTLWELGLAPGTMVLTVAVAAAHAALGGVHAFRFAI